MREPFRACLFIPVCGGGDAAAELVDPGGFHRSGMFVQVSELLVGVFGERGRGGALGDAVAAGGRGGGHQVIADGLADPGAQPGGQPGAGRHRGQPLGERLDQASVITAGKARFPPPWPDLPVAEGQVAGRGDVPVLDRAPGTASRALPCLFPQVRMGHDVHVQPAVILLRHCRHDQARNPEEQGRRRAPLHAAGLRGLRVPRAAGSVHGRRFPLLIPVSWSEQEWQGNRFSVSGVM